MRDGQDQNTSSHTADRTHSMAATDTVLSRKAASLRASTSWTPSEDDLLRGKDAQQSAFDLPTNLPLVEFARVCGKSSLQVRQDIDQRRLLALSAGPL